jgi:hypothetical protein
MALVNNSITVHQVPPEGGIFVKSLYDDVTTVVELVAGVALKHNYLTRFKIKCSTACTVKIGSGSTGNLDTLHIGPIPMTADDNSFCLDFNGSSGMKCDLGKALVLQISAGNASVYIEGKTSIK